MLRLVWAFEGHAEVVGFFLRELGQLHADAVQVQASDFLVQNLRRPDYVLVLVYSALGRD